LRGYRFYSAENIVASIGNVLNYQKMSVRNKEKNFLKKFSLLFCHG